MDRDPAPAGKGCVGATLGRMRSPSQRGKVFHFPPNFFPQQSSTTLQKRSCVNFLVVYNTGLNLQNPDLQSEFGDLRPLVESLARLHRPYKRLIPRSKLGISDEDRLRGATAEQIVRRSHAHEYAMDHPMSREYRFMNRAYCKLITKG